MKVADQRSIFNLFHDGSIIEIQKIKTGILLKMEIQYLAQMINSGYDNFLIELVNCSSFNFLNWENDSLISDLQEIAEMEPEVLSCSLQEINDLVIACNTFDGPGGCLNIITDNINIYDQSKKLVTFEQLDSISARYWDRTGNTQ